MLDPEREAEMELDGDSNDVSGSPTTRSPSQFMDYEMFSSLSPLYPSFDYSVSLWNSPSPGRWPQSPEFEISLWNFPSPSRGPSTEPGFSRLISSHGNASSSTQPPVRSASPPFREQGDGSLRLPPRRFVVKTRIISHLVEFIRHQTSRHQNLVEFIRHRTSRHQNDGENVLKEDAIHSAVSYPENEGTGKTLKREHGKIQIPLEDLLNFSGTLMDAVKQFQVSKSTIKRICRQHGITNWQCRTIDKNSQSLSEPKDIIESTQGEGAEMGNQMAGGSESRERELNHEQFGFPPESEKSLGMSQCIQASGELLKDHNISAIVAFNTEQVPESSRTNLSCSIPASKLPEATAAHMMPLVTEMQDTRTVTIKATYRGDMIRFQHSLTSGITELKREVAESLKLEVDTFSIKYLDDDDDWILMTCDKDLHECFKISVFLGRKFIKLSIHKM